MSRISTNRWDAIARRVERQSEQQRRPPLDRVHDRPSASRVARARSLLKAVSRESPVDDRRSWPVRSASSVAASAIFRAKNTTAATSRDEIEVDPRGSTEVDCADHAKSTTPPTTAGRCKPAWFASVPYHGMRPEFAHLGRTKGRDPSSDRRAAKTIAARMGAIETASCVPSGSRTGSAEQRGSARSRRRCPTRISSYRNAGRSDRRVGCPGSDGKHKSRDHERDGAEVTTPTM